MALDTYGSRRKGEHRRWRPPIERSGGAGLRRVGISAVGEVGPWEMRAAHWFLQATYVDCPCCEAATRIFSLFVGPECEIRDGNDAAWRKLEAFAFVADIKGLSEGPIGLLSCLSDGLAELSNDGVLQRCEQCGEVLRAADFQVAAMDRFSGSEKLPPGVEVAQRITARSMTAVLFHDAIEVNRHREDRNGYGRMVRLQVSDRDGELLSVGLFHNVERGDFAYSLADASGHERTAYGFEAAAFMSIRQLVHCVLAMGYAVEDVVEVSGTSIIGRLSTLMALSTLKAAGYEVDPRADLQVASLRAAVEMELAAL